MKKYRYSAVAAALAMSLSLFTGCLDDMPEDGSFPEETSAADKGADNAGVAAASTTAVSGEKVSGEADASADNKTGTEKKTGTRSRRTVIKGNNEDTFTVMVYMCGTDLETDIGAATYDILEMSDVEYNDNVNVLIYTGGTEEWQNSYISSDVNQIWKVVSDDLECVEEDMGALCMTDPDTLSQFVEYCDTNYHANRNALILWDHGGGAVYGYGSDQKYEDAPSMRIDEIDSALDNAGVDFDFIGFDACLMGTVETAYMLEEHADYMIASEEVEPGSGWYYTDWLNALCENTSIDTVELGKIIVDDFISASCEEDETAECTLSITDLTQMGNVYEKLSAFSAAASGMLDNNNFRSVSASRRDAKAFGTSDYDTIDLVHFAENLDIPESAALAEAVASAVVYKSNSDNISDCNGLSVFLPFTDLSYIDTILAVYDYIGLKGEHSDFVKAFANKVAGGQSNSTASSPFGESFGSSEPDYGEWEEYDWFDEDYASDYYDEYTYDSESLEVEQRDDYFALVLSDDDWDILDKIEMQIFFDDGDGYIDMGTDDYFDVDDDGALLVDYDGLWFTLNDIIVPFYITETTDTYTKGIIHCMLNDEEVNLVVLWDDTHDGNIIGAQRQYDTGISAKGLIPVHDGDVIQIICDYYTYDGQYEDDYLYSDAFEFDSSMTVFYSPSGAGDYLLYYVLTDLYNNEYYTEPVILTFDEDYFYDTFPEFFE